MANVIKTVYTYPLDGTTTDFAIPFEYLSRKFVMVTLIGQDRKELVVVTDYRFATRNLISTTKAWGPADNYQQIEIRRYTSASERLVDFSDGSILRATDLNVSQIQTLHVAEEARDLTADTIGVNNDGNLDGRGRRIVNVADGVDAGDVVTVGQMNRWSGSAADSANKAKVSETNAKTSEVNSKSSENASKTSETNSAASESMAQKWANNQRNTEVTTGKFSAFHWSENSKDSATAAGSSQSAAASSATASSNYATTSKDEADRSKTEADRSKTEADRARAEADKLVEFNTLTDSINSAATSTAELSSRVEQVYTNLSAAVDNNTAKMKSGQRYRRNVFTGITAQTQLGTGGTATLSEDCTGKLLYLGTHVTNLNTASLIYRCNPFIAPSIGEQLYLRLGEWTYVLECPAGNKLKLVSASGSSVTPINYIDVICDYPQT